MNLTLLVYRMFKVSINISRLYSILLITTIVLEASSVDGVFIKGPEDVEIPSSYKDPLKA